jgi:UDP-glucose 4-epimerase
MNALITGGAGFIGSHLAEALIERGDRVCVVDDLSTGIAQNIEHLQGKRQFSFINDSVLNERLMGQVIDDCDIIYHLAAAVGVKYIMENRLKTFEVNVQGTMIVLQLASKACLLASRKDKKKVMLASSSEVYGKNRNVLFSEDDDSVLGPTTVYRWSYADTKRIDEEFALAHLDERGLPIIIMRLFNTVGPRQLGRYGMVVPRFTERALAGEPLPVYGEGVQTRCFTYVDDVIRAMIALAECPDAVGQIFNIGGDEEISINDLARKIIKLANSSSTIKYIPYKEAYGEGFEDMMRRVPNISKIYRFIGWRPQVGLDETLIKMIEYFREKRGENGKT